MTKWILFLIGLSFSLPFTLSAQRYVDPAGTDSGTCPSGSPCATITYALTQASAGETIYLAAGTTYAGAVVNKSVTIQGTGNTTSVITGSGSGNGLDITANNVILQDFGVTNFLNGIAVNTVGISNLQLQNIASNSNTGAGFASNQSINGLTINNSQMNNNSTGSGLRRGLMLQSTTANYVNITITNSQFNGNSLVGLDVNGNNSISNITLTGNQVRNNGDSGIGIYAGVNTPSTNQILVNNNIIEISGNQRFGLEIKNAKGNGNSSGAGSVVVTDNQIFQSSTGNNSRDFAGIAIIARKTGNTLLPDPTGIVVTYNDIQNIQPGDGTCGTCGGNIGDGFGIAAGGTNHKIMYNRITGCKIGIQLQAGNEGGSTSADSPSVTGDANTLYFDRDNSLSCDGSAVNYNHLAGNTLAIRSIASTIVNNYTANWYNDVTGPVNSTNPSGIGVGLQSYSVTGTTAATFVFSTNNNAAYNPWYALDPDDVTGTSSGQRGVQTTSSKTFRILDPSTISVAAGPIQQGVTLASSTYVDVLDIQPTTTYTLPATVVLNKAITVLGNSGVIATKPIIRILATANATLTLFQITTNNVTVKNLRLEMGLTTTTGIKGVASTNLAGSVYGNALIEDNEIVSIKPQVTGTVFGAYGIHLSGGTTNTGIIIRRNTVGIASSGGPYDYFGRALGLGSAAVGGPAALVGGVLAADANTLTGIYAIQAIQMNAGALTIQNNTLTGQNQFNLSTSASHLISNNTYLAGGIVPVNTALQEIRSVQSGATMTIQNNTFQDHIGFGIFSGDSKGVTVQNNTFTPFAGATNYTHIHVNTKYQTGTVGITSTYSNSIDIKGNTFNGTTGGGGTAIVFANHLSGFNPCFAGVNIGGVGTENIFKKDIKTFFFVDPYVGTTNAATLVLPANATGTNIWQSLWTGYQTSTMQAVNVNFDLQNNQFEVTTGTPGTYNASALSMVQHFEVEDKITHYVDYSGIGFVRVKANQSFITNASKITDFSANNIPDVNNAFSNAVVVDGDIVSVQNSNTVYNNALSTTVTVNKSLTFQNDGNTTFRNLTMNGSGKTLTLNNDFIIDNALVCTNGIITTEPFRMYLSSSATITESTTSFLTGLLETDRTNFSIASAGTDVLGNIGLDISNAAGSAANFGVGVTQFIRRTGTIPIGNPGTLNKGIRRYFTVIPPTTLTGLNLNIVFHYLPSEVNTPSNIDGTLSLWRIDHTATLPYYDNIASTWTIYTSSINATPTITATGLTGFSTIAASGPTQPLPVVFLDFSGNRINETQNRLNWITESEKNNTGFEIYRSDDAVNFVKIGFIKGNGTSTQKQFYQWIDSLVSGTVYYQLKQIDNDQSSTFSNIISVNGADKKEDIQIHPNPVALAQQLKVSFTIDPNTEVSLEIFSIAGSQQFAGKIKLSRLEETLNLLNQSIQRGVSVLRIKTNEKTYVKKIIFE